MLSQAGFNLRKFRSSSANVLSQIPPELVEPLPNKELVDCHSDSYPKTLGIIWNSDKDTMATDVVQKSKFVPTKRGILSNVSKTFDVLGWIIPVIFPMKLLLQQLWKTKKGWDEAIDPELEQIHQIWREELPLLASISLPRCYFLPQKTVEVTLQGFSDASNKGYAAVVYIRATYDDSPPTSRMVVAKSRLAPKNTRTIPEMELLGAVLLSELLDTIRLTLEIAKESVHAYSDSTIVLGWLTKSPSQFKVFVANRITTINSILPSSQWHHVPTDQNPADCASRGISAKELRDHQLWWQGPHWLLSEPLRLPRQPHKKELDLCETEGARGHSCLAISGVPATWLAHKYSSLRTLTHVTAYVKRAAYNFLSFIRSNCRNTSDHLTVEEVQSATTFLLKLSQNRSYREEIKGLKKSPPEPPKSNSHILSFNPFLGQDGLLHIGGRLSNAPIPKAQKYPVLLSSKDPLTQLIFVSKHSDLCHCGPKMLFSTVGLEYYIPGAKKLARTVFQRCTTCKKYAAKAAEQLMGQLPAARVTEATGFHTVGVDYAGPFHLKTSRLRKSSTYKAYLAVFVCFATKAVHIEVVTGLTTEAFLAAMKRFIGRRARPKHVYSDNGSNFRGAKRDLEQLYNFLETTDMNEALRSYFLDNRTTWHTIPQRAPHFGGLWEAAVKSAKFHLKRVVGDQPLNYEELNTVVIQVEACLNSRPLIDDQCQDAEGMEPLTPSHLLIGKGMMAYPETEIDLKVAHSDRWTLCQSMVQGFWKRWSTEYLGQLQANSKWRTKKPNLQVGDVVLMKDAASFKTHWGLTRVVKVYPGDDGLVRAVDVKTCKVILPDRLKAKNLTHNQMELKSTVLKRPVSKLALLVSHSERVLPSGAPCSVSRTSP